MSKYLGLILNLPEYFWIFDVVECPEYNLGYSNEEHSITEQNFRTNFRNMKSKDK